MLNLSVLRANEIGTGYLIEYDAGHISPTEERNQPFINELKKLEGAGSPIITEPYYVYAVLQKYGIKNRNGRIYPEDILRSQAEAYKVLVSERRATGENDHPESSVISIKGISHNIVDIWWEGAVLMGKLEVLMSPGFINMGIVSTPGDMLANLLRHRIKIGVSSRGVGSVKEINGSQMVQKDFELICWDIVTNPSTPGSWIFRNNEDSTELKREVVENTDILMNSLDKFLFG